MTGLVLFLSALGIFSLVSISVSRRTREIGLRAALGATPRQVLAGILSRALMLMGSGIAAGGALLIWSLALGAGPSGRPAEDIALFAGYLVVTSAVMLAAVSAGLHRARSPRAQDQSKRRPEGGLNREAVLHQALPSGSPGWRAWPGAGLR